MPAPQLPGEILKLQLLSTLLIFATGLHAQESAGETQSIRCGALTHVLTSITTPSAFNEAMAQSTEFYSGVFASFREARTGAAATNGEISDRRDTVQAELRKTWRSKPEGVVQELALCNSWRAEYAPRIAALNGEIRSSRQLSQIVGSPPTRARDGETEKWAPIASTGFTAWAESGSQTGGEAKAEARRKIIESLKK